uniref:Glutathione gamma-glutamylcysteinyltransferase 1-like n=1 Tax=Rhizophora mucronata TaxID=61149 RepID=A0A2P2ILM1_RHIMU
MMRSSENGLKWNISLHAYESHLLKFDLCGKLQLLPQHSEPSIQAFQMRCPYL